MLKSFTHYLQGFLIMAGTSKGLSRVEPMNGEVLAIGLSLDKFVPSGFDSFRIGFGVICRRNEDFNASQPLPISEGRFIHDFFGAGDGAGQQ